MSKRNRTCLVDSCEGAAGVPGSARGWCLKHYKRWTRYGDPLGERHLAVGIDTCSISGCGDLVRARGWCVRHYTRWVRYGDAESRMPGEVRDGRRVCPRCIEDLPVETFSPTGSYCRPCALVVTAASRVIHPYVPVPGTAAVCDCCSQAFMANGRRSRYCSPACSRADKNRANWKHCQARRARLRTAFVEVFDRREIFKRDNWICQICMEPVDRDARFPAPKSVSLDHIIPIARGGAHSRANAQTACLGCNVRKGSRLIA